MEYACTIRRWALGLLALLACCPAALRAQNADEAGPHSPFFIIKTEGTSKKIDLLPLKSTQVAINVAGVVADITIRQEYVNQGTETLEALYVFPASTRAAVYGLEMQIGGRKIAAQIAEKETARQTYEQAKQEGKTATLLEQHRPNVFQMSVGHILPNDRVLVELRYTELLVPENGTYELVFPTVVGPRYADDFRKGLDMQWAQNPYLAEGQGPTYAYDITTHIEAGMPLQEVASSSHQVEVKYEGRSRARIQLSPHDKAGGTKDYVLQYRLAGKEVASGLLLFEGEKENFFLAMVQPPAQLESQQIPPREYVFILDVSGSMRGFPLQVSGELLTGLLQELRPQDRFNIMLFESSNTMLSPESLAPTKANIKMAEELLSQLRGSGGTNLLESLQKALKLPTPEGFSRSFVVVTDGYIAAEQEVFQIIKKNLGKANLYAIGVGSSVNRYLVEGMAHAGQGQPLVALSEADARRQIDKFRQYIAQVALTNISVNFGGTDVYDVTPLSVPDVLSDRPIVIFGKYRGTPSGTLQLSGKTGKEAYLQGLTWGQARPLPENGALRYLWARHRIAELGYEAVVSPSLGIAQEITQLGLQYNLLTQYTSFVAVDAVSRQSVGDEFSVQQALPLPQGVEGSAVAGGGISGAMPIAGAAPSRDAGTEAPVRSAPSRGMPGNGPAAALSFGMPAKVPAFAGNKVALGWSPPASGEAPDGYVVTVSNILGQALWSQETANRVVDLDLQQPIFAGAENRALLVKVAVKGKAGQESEPLLLDVLQADASNSLMAEGASLMLSQTASGKLALAQFYESRGLLANALGALREALRLAPGEAQQAYIEFLQRHGLL
jgi:Ca-activated chloride channel family protein